MELCRESRFKNRVSTSRGVPNVQYAYLGQEQAFWAWRVFWALKVLDDDSIATCIDGKVDKFRTK